MGFGKVLKKTVKSVGKQALKQVGGDILSPEGILTTVAPQVGVTNALVKGMTGGKIDPLSIATGVGKNLLKGKVRGGEIVDDSGNVLDVVSGGVKVSPENYSALKSELMEVGMESIEKVLDDGQTIKTERQTVRASLRSGNAEMVSGVDLAQNNSVSRIFTSVAKSLGAYKLGVPAAPVTINTRDYASLSGFAAYVDTSVDVYYEGLTDLVRAPLVSSPVSDVSALISLLNAILEKLDNDTAMIEFLACFNYPGSEVIMPNIEGSTVLAASCLKDLTGSVVYKYMSAWVMMAYQNSHELEFYQEIISEWLGTEVAITHPFYIDMLSAAVISLKGGVIAQYLLEYHCPYLCNTANSSFRQRYLETKDNPYDLLQFVRNLQLMAQISYSASILPAYTTAQAGIAFYHQRSYIVLSLVAKVLNDANMFKKSCLSSAQLTEIYNEMFISKNFEYVFELCNDEFAWVTTINNREMGAAIVDAQLSAGGIVCGEREMSITEIEEALDAVYSTATSGEVDFAVADAYRTRVHSLGGEFENDYARGDIDEMKYRELKLKCSQVINALNAAIGG